MTHLYMDRICMLMLVSETHEDLAQEYQAEAIRLLNLLDWVKYGTW